LFEGAGPSLPQRSIVAATVHFIAVPITQLVSVQGCGAHARRQSGSWVQHMETRRPDLGSCLKVRACAHAWKLRSVVSRRYLGHAVEVF
jgi:hypothetical protein